MWIFSIYILNGEKKGLMWNVQNKKKREELKIFIKLYQKPINFYPKWHFTIFRRHGARQQKQNSNWLESVGCLLFQPASLRIQRFCLHLFCGNLRGKNPIRKINRSASRSNESCVRALLYFVYVTDSFAYMNNAQFAAAHTLLHRVKFVVFLSRV